MGIGKSLNTLKHVEWETYKGVNLPFEESLLEDGVFTGTGEKGGVLGLQVVVVQVNLQRGGCKISYYRPQISTNIIYSQNASYILNTTILLYRTS